MMLFTFLAFILLLAGECFYIKKKTLIPLIFFGTMAAALLCAFRAFFLFAHRVIPYSFGDNFVFLFFRQVFLPLIILYGLFFFISRDSLDFKIEMFLPLMTSFYMLYLPFCIISSAEGLYSAFGLFVKPILFAAMLFQLSFSLWGLKKSFEERKILLAVMYGFLLLLYIIAPALIEAFYMISAGFLLSLLFSILYCAIPVFLGVMKLIHIQ